MDLAGGAAPAETNLSPISRAAFSQALLLPGSFLPGRLQSGAPPGAELLRIGKGCLGCCTPQVDGWGVSHRRHGDASPGVVFCGGRDAAGSRREHLPVSTHSDILPRREKSQHPPPPSFPCYPSFPS